MALFNLELFEKNKLITCAAKYLQYLQFCYQPYFMKKINLNILLFLNTRGHQFTKNILVEENILARMQALKKKNHNKPEKYKVILH